MADPDTADANALDAGEESQAAQEESFADGMRSQRKVNPLGAQRCQVAPTRDSEVFVEGCRYLRDPLL